MCTPLSSTGNYFSNAIVYKALCWSQRGSKKYH
jgi:hypothetical protein